MAWSELQLLDRRDLFLNNLLLNACKGRSLIVMGGSKSSLTHDVWTLGVWVEVGRPGKGRLKGRETILFYTLPFLRKVSLDTAHMRSICYMFCTERIHLLQLRSLMILLGSTIKKCKSKHFVQCLRIDFDWWWVWRRSFHQRSIDSLCFFLTSFLCIAIVWLLASWIQLLYLLKNVIRIVRNVIHKILSFEFIFNKVKARSFLRLLIWR